MAAESVFLDTNVLVYINRPGSDHHDACLAALGRLRDERCPLWISPQVVREYLSAEQSDPLLASASLAPWAASDW